MTNPTPYRKILAATDFSPHADAAVRQAEWIARQADSPLTLVHVLRDVQAQIASLSYELLQGEFAGEEAAAFERERRLEAERRLKESAALYPAMRDRVACQVRLGTPFVEITHAVQAEGHDLVVTGTRGLSAFKQFLLGSTAQRLIRKCPSDVWVVKHTDDRPPLKIVVPLDYSEASSRALRHAAWLAGQAKAELHVLHVVDSADVPADLLEAVDAETSRPTMRRRVQLAARAHLGDFLQRNLPPGTEAQSHFSWGTSWKEIVRVVRRLSADLVVMGTVGRSGISGLLLGNTAERVLGRCDCSILTVKPAGFVSPIQSVGQAAPDANP